MNNTLLRAEFNYKFALFTLSAVIIHKINFIVTDFIRTAIEQNKRFKEKKSLCDGYKKISKHQKARAKDLVIIDKKGNPIWEHIPEYDKLGEIWSSIAGKENWGGTWFKEGKTTFNDIYHFQY